MALGSHVLPLLSRGASLTCRALPPSPPRSFYSAVSASGLADAVQSLSSGGTPPRWVVIDDGWQCTEVGATLRLACCMPGQIVHQSHAGKAWIGLDWLWAAIVCATAELWLLPPAPFPRTGGRAVLQHPYRAAQASAAEGQGGGGWDRCTAAVRWGIAGIFPSLPVSPDRCNERPQGYCCHAWLSTNLPHPSHAPPLPAPRLQTGDASLREAYLEGEMEALGQAAKEIPAGTAMGAYLQEIRASGAYSVCVLGAACKPPVESESEGLQPPYRRVTAGCCLQVACCLYHQPKACRRPADSPSAVGIRPCRAACHPPCRPPRGRPGCSGGLPRPGAPARHHQQH